MEIKIHSKFSKKVGIAKTRTNYALTNAKPIKQNIFLNLKNLY